MSQPNELPYSEYTYSCYILSRYLESNDTQLNFPLMEVDINLFDDKELTDNAACLYLE